MSLKLYNFFLKVLKKNLNLEKEIML